MLSRSLWLAAFLAVAVQAQSSDSTLSGSSDSRTGSSSSSGSGTGSGTSSPSIVTLTGSEVSVVVPTGSYKSIDGQITNTNQYRSTSSSASSSGSGSGSSSRSVSTTAKPGTTSIATILAAGGIITESIINGTITMSSHLNSTRTVAASGTGSSALPTNTQACNNYPEFCNRQYGNITEVCAHNSAFVKKGNAASNQKLGITTQLNDGIRMIQGETHWVNNTIWSCHTSCDILNAGTYLSELQTVAAWVRDHPYDVVTILIVNSDYVDVGNYSSILDDSGLSQYIYEPPYIPMHLDQWPTLSEMILSQKRVVVFMDYQANQAVEPRILDEFTHMWETPFSPTDVQFPCTTQRPPNLNQTVAREELMYLVNHNLNTDISLFGTSILIPNTATIDTTNAAGFETGMLGLSNQNCTAMWNRPPNWLLVDYYSIGNGSVFEVAARANNVTYNRQCCGANSSDASNVKSSSVAWVVVLMVISYFIM